MFSDILHYVQQLTFIHLSGGDGLSLDEVVLHVALEVEVGELILLVELEELGELLIGVDLAAIGLVLKTIGSDVGIDLLAHIRAGHLGANGLGEEGGELLADGSGLDEARGLAVAVVTALLGGGLLGGLHLAGDRLLEGLEVVLHGGEETDKLLELGGELRELKRKHGGIGGRDDGGLTTSNGGRGGSLHNGGGGLGLASTGLNSSSLASGGGSSDNRSNGSGGSGLSSSNHSGYYNILEDFFFISLSKQINKLWLDGSRSVYLRK